MSFSAIKLIKTRSEVGKMKNIPGYTKWFEN